MKISYNKTISLLLASFFVVSCSNREKIIDTEFKLPANITLTAETFFNPLSVDNLFGSPNRTEILWKSATFKKCLITKMSITKNKYLKKEIEKLIYQFDNEGLPKDKLPAASYVINSDWAQTEKVKEWNYDKNSKLNAFKEWGNRFLIKDLLFHYSENGVLQRVNFNKDEFSFEYNK